MNMSPNYLPSVRLFVGTFVHFRTNPEFDTYASRRPPPNSSINLHRNMARLTLLLVAIVAAMATAFVPASGPLARSGKLYSSVVAWTSFQ